MSENTLWLLQPLDGSCTIPFYCNIGFFSVPPGYPGYFFHVKYAYLYSLFFHTHYQHKYYLVYFALPIVINCIPFLSIHERFSFVWPKKLWYNLLHGILLLLKWSSAICNKIAPNGSHYAQWNKPILKV